MPNIAAVIIGNEILTGKFADENGPWLAKRCRALGVDLGRIAIISDEIPVIAEEVARCAARYDYVFTTGGVGPTHDDVTMKGVAAAFGVPLARHPELVKILVEKLGDRCTEAALRMADVPEGAALWWDGDLVWPLVVAKNVAIFPGVPSLFKRKFDGIAHRLSGVPVIARRLETLARETEIADQLTAIQDRFPSVAIGSYPHLDARPQTVTITLDARDEAALLACYAALREALADGLIDDGDAP